MPASTYCFGNETAKQLFLKKPDEFLLKAQIFYSSKRRNSRRGFFQPCDTVMAGLVPAIHDCIALNA